MQNPACRGGRKDREAENANVIFEIVCQINCQVAGKQNDAPGVVEALCQCDQALGVKAVFQALQILQVLIQGFKDVRGHAPVKSAGLHGVQGCCVGEGEFVQMALKLAIAFESKTSHDAHNGC